MTTRLAHLLTSCSAGSLPPSDQRELSSLLSEFMSADTGAIVTDSDSDCYSDDDQAEGDQHDHEENDDDDYPLVLVEEASGDAEMEEDVFAVDDGGMLQRARTRCCKANGAGCKQLKVPSQQGDLRRGCITQFDPEEIVALQLSLQDMSRGEF